MKKSETVDQLPLSGAVNADGRSTTTTRHLRLYCLPALRCAFHQSRYAASFSFHSSSCYGVTSFPDRELKWLALSGRTTASHLLPLLLLLLLQHPTASSPLGFIIYRVFVRPPQQRLFFLILPAAPFKPGPARFFLLPLLFLIAQ